MVKKVYGKFEKFLAIDFNLYLNIYRYSRLRAAATTIKAGKP